MSEKLGFPDNRTAASFAILEHRDLEEIARIRTTAACAAEGEIDASSSIIASAIALESLRNSGEYKTESPLLRI